MSIDIDIQKKRGPYSIACMNEDIEGDNCLDALREANIFSIGKVGGGDSLAFCISECCDGYYKAYLTKEQMIDLGNEILNLANE